MLVEKREGEIDLHCSGDAGLPTLPCNIELSVLSINIPAFSSLQCGIP